MTMLACAMVANAQQRYVDKVYSGVTVTKDVVYGRNITVINASLGQTFTEQDLKMDVYEPDGDTASQRPVVIIAHSGNFLPGVLNGSPFGGYPNLTLGALACNAKTDSAVVELCTEFAKRGYVAVAFNYRLGWNPTSTQDSIRRSTLLQAAFRGIQDMRTVVRYLRKDFAASNTFKVDTGRIAVGGIGTGGYIALGTGYLNDPVNEIYGIQKFKFPSGKPYVYVTIPGTQLGFGGLGGEDTSYYDPGYTTKLNLGNHKGYSNKIHFVFNLGGALGDSAWINAGEVPLVAVQLPNDPYAPYDKGDVLVPGIPLPIIPNATGAGRNVGYANSLGNNAPIAGPYTDPYTARANAINGGQEGLFPMLGYVKSDSIDCDNDANTPKNPGDVNSGPWNWYSEGVFQATWTALGGSPSTPGQTAAVANCRTKNGMKSFSGTSNDPAFARTIIDTAVSYIAPRFARASGYNTVSVENSLLQSVKVYPNPAQTRLNILSNNTATLRSVTLFDVTGKPVFTQAVTDGALTIERGDLPAGLYLLNMQFDQGTATRRVVFE